MLSQTKKQLIIKNFHAPRLNELEAIIDLMLDNGYELGPNQTRIEFNKSSMLTYRLIGCDNEDTLFELLHDGIGTKALKELNETQALFAESLPLHFHHFEVVLNVSGTKAAEQWETIESA